jgi:hypothetical protein
VRLAVVVVVDTCVDDEDGGGAPGPTLEGGDSEVLLAFLFLAAAANQAVSGEQVAGEDRG